MGKIVWEKFPVYLTNEKAIEGPVGGGGKGEGYSPIPPYSLLLVGKSFERTFPIIDCPKKLLKGISRDHCFTSR
jgi:hypothetical protein